VQRVCSALVAGGYGWLRTLLRVAVALCSGVSCVLHFSRYAQENCVCFVYVGVCVCGGENRRIVMRAASEIMMMHNKKQNSGI